MLLHSKQSAGASDGHNNKALKSDVRCLPYKLPIFQRSQSNIQNEMDIETRTTLIRAKTTGLIMTEYKQITFADWWQNYGEVKFARGCGVPYVECAQSAWEAGIQEGYSRERDNMVAAILIGSQEQIRKITELERRLSAIESAAELHADGTEDGTALDKFANQIWGYTRGEGISY